MRQIVRTSRAVEQIEDCIVWSGHNFGRNAAIRYTKLIETALRDIRDNDTLLGARNLAEVHPNAKIYHLRHSRHRAEVNGIIVKKPRHFILYLDEPTKVTILRVLHDSMDLEERINDDGLKNC